MRENPQYRGALDWINVEHDNYQTIKWSQERDDDLTAEEWRGQVDMYLHRATVLGIDNPLGRQAVGKAAATAVAYLENMLRRYQELPAPGFPSGTIKGWFRVE